MTLQRSLKWLRTGTSLQRIGSKPLSVPLEFTLELQAFAFVRHLRIWLVARTTIIRIQNVVPLIPIANFQCIKVRTELVETTMVITCAPIQEAACVVKRLLAIRCLISVKLLSIHLHPASRILTALALDAPRPAVPTRHPGIVASKVMIAAPKRLLAKPVVSPIPIADRFCVCVGWTTKAKCSISEMFQTNCL
jgi:hypothetical protein